MHKSPLPGNKNIQNTTPTYDSNSEVGRPGVSTDIKLNQAFEAFPSLTHLTDLTKHRLCADIVSRWAQPRMKRLLSAPQSFLWVEEPDREARQLQPCGKGLWLRTQDRHPARNCVEVCRSPREQWLSRITPELGGLRGRAHLAHWLCDPGRLLQRSLSFLI